MRDYRWTDREPSGASCRKEVAGLHEFFVDWYTGRTDRAGFDRVAEAIAPGFERIGPDGTPMQRDDLLDSIRETYDTYGVGAFEIEIRNVEVVSRDPGFALVQYEEWQSVEGATNGRISTAMLRPTERAPTGLAWVALQETWLEE